MYGNYYYGSYNPYSSMYIAVIVISLIAIAAAIVLFATFMRKANEYKYTGFTKWLYDFLHFKKLFSEAALKFLYIAGTVYLVLLGLYYLIFSGLNFGYRLLLFFASAVVANVVIRILYEFLIIRLVVCKNTTEINDKLSVLTGNKPNSADNRAIPGPVNNRPAPGPGVVKPNHFGESGKGYSFCPNCGSPVDPSTGVCQNCGTYIS